MKTWPAIDSAAQVPTVSTKRREGPDARGRTQIAAVALVAMLAAFPGASSAASPIDSRLDQLRAKSPLGTVSPKARQAGSPSRCRTERRKTVRAATQLRRSERALRRSSGDRRSGRRAARQVMKGKARLHRQRARSNRACGIRVEMRLARNAIKAPATAIAAVRGDPARGQQVILERGAKAPRPGGVLVVDASSTGPGILGKVTASKRLGDGRTRLSLEPATLDQAYRQFDLRFDGSPAALVDSPLLVGGEPRAESSARASANKLKAFSCEGPQIEKPDVLVDLTQLQVNSEIDVQRRHLHFLVSGRPALRLRFELKAGASCRLNERVRVFIPIAGPVGIDLVPVLEVSAGGDSKLDFAMAPRIAVGFQRGTSSDQDFRVFNPMGGPAMSLHGALGVNAFAGGSIAVSVGGRAGIRGKFGPALSLQATAGSGRICGDVSGALRSQLDVYADVFIANLSVRLAKGDFLPRVLYSRCVGGGGGDSSSGVADPRPDPGSDPSPDLPPLPSETHQSLSAGEAHTCALRSDNTVACWGSNHSGESTPPSGTFKSLSAGQHTCGIRSNDTLACWGPDWYGQSSPPMGAFTAVTAGAYHSCGLRGTGDVECWGEPPAGENAYGQANPPSGTFRSVSAGDLHTCAVQIDGAVSCWGRNNQGQSSSPSGSFQSVSAGAEHTCGIKVDDTAECWGADHYGQSSPPGGTFKTVSAAGGHTCGVRTSGGLACWGGPPEEFDYCHGCASPPAGAFQSVTAGGNHTCGIRAGGSIACWGDDEKSQSSPPLGAYKAISTGGQHTCGIRAVDDRVACWGHYWSIEPLAPPEGTFKSVSSGWQHACGLRGDSTVACWIGEADEYDFGQADPPGGTFKGVSAGGFHSCGVRSDSTLACWGSPPALPGAEHDHGQAVPPVGAFKEVSAGGYHTCGIRADDTVVCWGDDSEGQLSTPSGTFKTVSAGDLHSCGIRADDTVACWGDNRSWESSPPTGAFASVEAGGQNSCGVRPTNLLACWGRDFYQEASPPAGSFKSVGVGGSFFSCGIRADDRVACWGYMARQPLW